MPHFSDTITNHWRAQFLNGDAFCGDGAFSVVVNPDLPEDSRVMVLQQTDGQVLAVLTPALAERAGFSRGRTLSETEFRRKLSEADITLHGADYLLYFTQRDRATLCKDKIQGGCRRLTMRDEAAFSHFQSSASEQDRDDALVELDHWAVFGAFEEDCLVSAASAYPWDDAAIADMGVMTLAAFRGRGHARNLVRSISQFAGAQGYEPQYRCQLDNVASIALAKAAGLTLFGKWEVVSPDSPH